MYKIRKSELKDAKELDKLLTKLIQDEAKYDKNVNTTFKVENFYENIITKEDYISFLIEKENKIIAYIYGYITKDKTEKKTISTLDALYIEENYRNQGISQKLIDEFKKWSKQKNAKYIEVSVLTENKIASHLYEKNNFKEIKRTLRLEINEEEDYNNINREW